MVSTSSFGPPIANEAFSLFSPSPGIFTNESRGSDIKATWPFSARCTSIIVSERCPSVSSLKKAFSLESDPASRYVVPGIFGAVERASVCCSEESAKDHSE